ncbi:hydroxysqualene dehydroxylase HpnE [Rubrivivax rivuli]|uniref:Phytoene dehydrogenase n=1 Tax=Rubrivivax rivuli TaxID=1862385 RepID=A0A437RFE4_9BURK|nr:hydroxysqualene dehydroxylase HpnE [Rubrivivax rivuli]RVU45434.1 phytoene dehydrogenase [Rubrivivax rivuli]
MKIAVIGAGWAGLAAAQRATETGHAVTVFEMASQAGGRARELQIEGLALDNGQHILIGAYRETLALMRRLGVDVDAAFDRRPLELRYPDGRGLRLPPGPAALVFGLGVLRARGWNLRDKLALLRAAAGWALAGFRCAPGTSVDTLCRGLPPAVRELMIDPLCVAALNTPAEQADAGVLLRVLKDALFGGAGGADLLLPRRSLGALLPAPATAWLQARGADLRLGTRVQQLQPAGGSGWLVDGVAFDAVVLACSAAEAARLALPFAQAWATQAQALRYEPIVTVYLQAPGARLAAPMMALVEGPAAPAQFAFDHGAMGATPGVFAFVVSGAQAWVERGLEATSAAVMAQATQAFPAGTWPQAPTLLRCVAEKRATFRCVPGLERPPSAIAPGLSAAGDYVAGPYPATLEGAVRAGLAAADEAALAGGAGRNG